MNKHTPLDKAVHAIPMLYAEAFAGSNNKEFVVELYSDARLLETAAPAMYEALTIALQIMIDKRVPYQHEIDQARAALAQAEGRTL